MKVVLAAVLPFDAEPTACSVDKRTKKSLNHVQQREKSLSRAGAFCGKPRVPFEKPANAR